MHACRGVYPFSGSTEWPGAGFYIRKNKSLQFSPRFVLIVALAPCFRDLPEAPLSPLVLLLLLLFFSGLQRFLSGAYWQLSNIGFLLLLLFHQWHEAILINRRKFANFKVFGD